MTHVQKENIQYGTALVMLLAGIVLAFVGFLTPPKGEIHDSVLWLFAQCLIYAGSVFGLSLYVHNAIDKRLRNHRSASLLDASLEGQKNENRSASLRDA